MVISIAKYRLLSGTWLTFFTSSADLHHVLPVGVLLALTLPGMGCCSAGVVLQALYAYYSNHHI